MLLHPADDSTSAFRCVRAEDRPVRVSLVMMEGRTMASGTPSPMHKSVTAASASNLVFSYVFRNVCPESNSLSKTRPRRSRPHRQY